MFKSSVFAIKVVDPEVRYSVEMNMLQFSEEWKQEDEDLCDDVRMARFLVSIANSLEEDIQMTYNTPSMNSNGCMLVLDLQLWCDDGQVLFSFYERKMISNYVLLKDVFKSQCILPRKIRTIEPDKSPLSSNNGVFFQLINCLCSTISR